MPGSPVTFRKSRDTLCAVAAKLTNEQRQALRREPDKPLRVEDEKTHEVFFLVSAEAVPTLWNDYLRTEVNKGLDAHDRGDVSELDINKMLSEAQRRRKADGSGTPA